VSIPLIVDPTTIPISCERTSGVNQAVKPSKMPRTPPSKSPSNNLFICFPPYQSIQQNQEFLLLPRDAGGTDMLIFTIENPGMFPQTRLSLIQMLQDSEQRSRAMETLIQIY